MHSREQQYTNLPIPEKANVTIDLNGKTKSCDGMQPARLNRTTSHLAPNLGGVAASMAHLTVLARTHWHVRVPVLCKQVSQPIC